MPGRSVWCWGCRGSGAAGVQRLEMLRVGVQHPRVLGATLGVLGEEEVVKHPPLSCWECRFSRMLDHIRQKFLLLSNFF